jgi:hypothetical protein
MTRRASRRISLAAAALAAAAAISVIGAAQSQAAPVTFTGGHLDWGVRQSFRVYIEANPADGEIRLSGGAFRTADGGIRFPVDHADGGSYDATTELGEIRLGGAVRFTSHQTQPGSGIYGLDLTFSQLRLAINGDDGVLLADAASKDSASSPVEQVDDLELAAVDLSAAGPTAGLERFTWASSPVRLTQDAVDAGVFGAFYGTNELLDPAFLTASHGVPVPPPAAPTLSTEPLSPANQNSPRIKGTAPAGTVVKVYWSNDCSEAPIASGTAAELAGQGLAVHVPDNSTATFTAIAQGEDSASACSAPVSYTELTPGPGGPPGGGGTTPPTGQKPPAGSVEWISLQRPKGARRVGRSRSVAVATIGCLRGPCSISVAKRVRVRIAKRAFWLTLHTRRETVTGARTKLTLKLPRKAAARLAGRRIGVKLKVVATSGGKRETFRFTTVLKRPAR